MRIALVFLHHHDAILLICGQERKDDGILVQLMVRYQVGGDGDAKSKKRASGLKSREVRATAPSIHSLLSVQETMIDIMTFSLGSRLSQRPDCSATLLSSLWRRLSAVRGGGRDGREKMRERLMKKANSD